MQRQSYRSHPTAEESETETGTPTARELVKRKFDMHRQITRAKNLTHAEKSVLNALWDRADVKTMSAFLTNETLADEACVDPRGLRRKLMPSLIEKGFVLRMAGSSRANGEGKRQASVYLLRIPAEADEGGTQNHEGGTQTPNEGGTQTPPIDPFQIQEEGRDARQAETSPDPVAEETPPQRRTKKTNDHAASVAASSAVGPADRSDRAFPKQCDRHQDSDHDVPPCKACGRAREQVKKAAADAARAAEVRGRRIDRHWPPIMEWEPDELVDSGGGLRPAWLKAASDWVAAEEGRRLTAEVCARILAEVKAAAPDRGPSKARPEDPPEWRTPKPMPDHVRAMFDRDLKETA